MGANYASISVQVDADSLGDVPFESFGPLFRAELEKAFPGSSIEITCGTGARIDFAGLDRDDEAVYLASENAFALACEGVS